MSAPARRARSIVVTAGGTGGHLFPALATAELLADSSRPVVLLCDARAAAYLSELKSGIPHRTIAAASPRGGPANLVCAALLLGAGSAQAFVFFMRRRPRAVIAFGGYGSVPAALAARLVFVPLILHEQNRKFGLANRFLARFANCIAVSSPDPESLAPRLARRTVVTGTPVRRAVADLAGLPYPQPTEGGALRLLVLGGSQGARLFDELMPSAMDHLPEPLRARLSVVQQTQGDPEALERAYAALGVQSEARRFFPDISARLVAAHLVVARAGASTVAELATVGRPCLLIPYPHATGGHQESNAHAFVAEGGGQILHEEGLTAERLASALSAWLGAPSRLASAAAALGHKRTQRGAERLIDCLDEVLRGRRAGSSTRNKADTGGGEAGKNRRLRRSERTRKELAL